MTEFDELQLQQLKDSLLIRTPRMKSVTVFIPHPANTEAAQRSIEACKDSDVTVVTRDGKHFRGGVEVRP